MRIAIAGNMGSGKTTLTKLLAEKFGGQAFFEPFADNPYLSDFYKDMHRYALPSQLYFLRERFASQKEIDELPGLLVQDRTAYEDAEIFAATLHDRGFMSDRDWKLYWDFYTFGTSVLLPPDLVIYLPATVPTLLSRIAERGREFEKNVDPAYIEHLNQRYESWASSFTQAPLLKLSVDEFNFRDDASHLNHAIGLIKTYFSIPEPLFL